MLKSTLATATLFAVSVAALVPISAQASPPAGEWQTDYGPLSLMQSENGPGVTGSYQKGYSQIEGRLAADRVLEAQWFKPNSAQKCDRPYNGTYYWGQLRFEFSLDFTTFEGLWSYCDQEVSRNWDGDQGNLLGFGADAAFAGSNGGNGPLTLPPLGSCSALDNNIFSPVGEDGSRFSLSFRLSEGQYASVMHDVELNHSSGANSRGPIAFFQHTVSMGRGASYLQLNDGQNNESFPLYFFDASLQESGPEDSKYMVVGSLGSYDYYSNSGSRDLDGYLGDVMWERRCK